MSKITFQMLPITVNVKLDGKLVGHIAQTDKGFKYVPKGQKVGGNEYPTLQECMDSLQTID